MLYVKPIRKTLNGFTYLGLYAAAFFGVVILRLQDRLAGLFALFGKNATFTGRTEIWDTALGLMADPTHMVLGYGAQFTSGFQAGNWYTGSAHNTVLQILMLGGWVALVLLVILMVLAAFQSFKGRNDRLHACLSLTLGCMLVIGLTENICTVSLFLVLALMFYAPQQAVKVELPDEGGA